ncbi:MAG TPA: site-2 protease family protein [Polyangiaceae bacterium]|nr:site-2 protease family protein [Polyangiaceae bacterium]
MSVEHDLPRFPAAPPPVDAARALSPRLESLAPASEAPIQFDWRKNAILFGLTVVSVFYVGHMWIPDAAPGVAGWVSGWTFAVPLLVILLFHEFGHYIAARLHRVPASLPYFLPLPILSPFGTLGAVILMPNRIRSRKALLDIGAAGPLAGLLVAIPILLYGLSLSELGPRNPPGMYTTQEGQSLLYMALKYAVFGFYPAQLDVHLHPTAYAGWAGFFVTFLNLLPFGQLDGGHVAYALLGERQNRFARWVFFAPLVLFAYNFAIFAWPVLRRGLEIGFGNIEGVAWMPVTSSLSSWMVLFLLLSFMRRGAGLEHPPVDDHDLSAVRKAIAIFTLALFVLLFMPSPMVMF